MNDSDGATDARSRFRQLLLMSAALLFFLTAMRVGDFVLGIWVYERSGSASQFSLVFLFTTLPAIVLSPFGGVLADRWKRRSILVLTSLGSAVMVGAVAAVVMIDRLEVWHVYLAAFVLAGLIALQWPAYVSSIALLVRKDQLARANGLIQLIYAAARLVSPVLGGALLSFVRLKGAVVFELLALLISFLVFAAVVLPAPARHPAGAAQPVFGVSDFLYGWRYISARRPLKALMIFSMANTFVMGIVTVLAVPMVLAFSSKAILGTILFTGGLGMVLGSAFVGAGKRPASLVNGLIFFQCLVGISIAAAGMTVSVPVVMAAAFCCFFGLAVVNSYYNAIWQGAVEPDVQGRVLSVRQTVTLSSLLLAYMSAGLLADGVFEPLMAAGGVLADTVGGVIGAGPGRGIGLMFFILGCASIVGACFAGLSRDLAQSVLLFDDREIERPIVK